MLQREVKYYGSPDYLDHARKIILGDFSFLYQNGAIRYLKFRETEILRMIYSAVRDQNWGTLNFEIRNENIQTSQEGFRIAFEAWYGKPSVFKVNYEFSGSPKGLFHFSMKGASQKEFFKNRIGFCVLHPVEECMGTNCEIVHPDNSKTSGIFPVNISPHQPFTNIRKMKWTNKSVDCELEFEGDIFETEDQRNWTDASYKTYCPPLDYPFPVKLEPGTKIEQQIFLKLNPHNYSKKEIIRPKSEVVQATRYFPFTKIGYLHNERTENLNSNEIRILKALKINHLRLDLDFSNSEFKKKSQNFFKDLIALDTNAEICLHLSSRFKAEINEFINLVLPFKDKVKFVGILTKEAKSTSTLHLIEAAQIIKSLLPEIKLGAGTNYDFTDLNRSPVNTKIPDYVFYSICPQVHAFDNLSLTETLTAQKYTVETAKSISGNLPIQVSAISLKRRSNPDATGNIPPDKVTIQGNIDPRQMSLFNAAWTASCLKNLNLAGADSITLYELKGMKGLIFGDGVNKFQEIFPAKKGSIYPVYYLLKAISDFKPEKIRNNPSLEPLKYDVLELINSSGKLSIAINFTQSKAEIRLQPEISEARIFSLDENSFENWYQHKEPWLFDPATDSTKTALRKVSLAPFSVSFIYH